MCCRVEGVGLLGSWVLWVTADYRAVAFVDGFGGRLWRGLGFHGTFQRLFFRGGGWEGGGSEVNTNVAAGLGCDSWHLGPLWV